MTLASDISTTSTSLSDIKNAIIAKGVTPSGNITTYAAAIMNIVGSDTPYSTIVALENTMRGTSEVASVEEAEACDDISLFLYGTTNS